MGATVPILLQDCYRYRYSISITIFTSRHYCAVDIVTKRRARVNEPSGSDESAFYYYIAAQRPQSPGNEVNPIESFERERETSSAPTNTSKANQMKQLWEKHHKRKKVK